MFDHIRQSLKKIGHYSLSEQELITERLERVTYQQGEFLLNKGELCQYFFFLEEGLVRHYYQTEALDEINIHLWQPGDWMLDHQSFTSRRPTANRMICEVPTSVQRLSIDALHELIGISPTFFSLGRILEGVAINPYHQDIKASPEEKYKKLMAEEPELLQHFPLKQIATYLGVTPETLSRVRKRISL